ncbi:anaerobic ribonucleoside-triphosphate reductase-like protein [Hydrogenoanaerobacterium saccharovorans]|uniref:Ribonucleoside-triphosphate reductase n=1 Tax=Hydrogenoanaerobacterium saccharovorans TaxID=474960 RepID=A0A1H8BC94_9FIRM|nr:anaerobic ribonucleoside-triphosphate reductase [Hydrogenoanaerobacterium saccharovorans]RPF47519.1 anaerobic ribonucleoside-triphosphate reductase-like protein [Hydrogenoanaerobacterium saccharovorans]SEM79477.1 ribonucleoside-triphosphate reductase [Hydrogenoanaerobacterium saccharovorans]
MNSNTQTVGEGIGFERIRRITGYLVGTVDRFNNAKRAEEHDRVKHGLEPEKI